MNTRQFLLKLRLSTGYTILLVFLMWGQRVQAQTPPEVRPATRPLNEVLDAEGRLRPNLPAGSFDPKGFRMVQDANGAPRFLPESGGQDLGTRPFVTQSPTDDDANWDSRFENQDAVNGIYAFAQDAQGNLYVGGDFLRIGGVKANNIAKYSPSTNTWSSLGQGTNGVVYALAVLGSDLYVGGWFRQAGGVPANYIAKYSPSTNTWSSLYQYTNGVVYALAVLGSDLYVGGYFTQAGGVSANRIAKYSPGSNTWSSLGSGVDGWVYALAVLGSDLYVGGSFLSAGGKISPRLALWHGASLSASLSDTIDPQTILLDQNYPNPFNPGTRIGFWLPEDLMVKLEVYDVMGRKVLSVADGFMRAGMHEYPVHLEGLPSGTYWYVLQAGNVQKVRRMTFIR